MRFASAAVLWRPCAVALFIATAGAATAREDAAAAVDAASTCREHLLSNPGVMDMNFYTGMSGQNFASFERRSPKGRRLDSIILFHVISVVSEDGPWSDVCVGIVDTTTYTDSFSSNEWQSAGWVTTHVRSDLPVGIVRTKTRCWRSAQLKFANCDTTFKPIYFVKNLPQFNYSPLERDFWVNSTTERIGVDPTWIWKINTRTLKGSFEAEWLSDMDIPSLEELEFIGNDWRRPKSLFRPLPKLRIINFSYNNLEIVPNGTFIELPSIEKLNLGHNNISVFPSGVRHLKSLWLLDLTNPLGNATLTITDEDVESIPKSIRTIGLENTKLSINASNLIIRSGLSFLNFSGCSLRQINDLQDANQTTSSLTVLDLSSNKLKSLPLTIFKEMPNLEKLFLSNNELQIWQQDLLERNSLKVLDLSRNLITNLTKFSFKHLHNLTCLDISGNKIKTLPPEVFQGMLALLNIDLSHNSITLIPFDLFKHTPKIQKINAAYNNITKPPYLWNYSLEKLDMSHNNLTYFNSNILNLKELILSFNYIQELNTSNVNKLNISYNSLNYISADMWKNITHLEEVDIGGHNFECCLFENNTYFKNTYRTKIMTLGDVKELTCSVNRTSPKIVLRTFSYNETECNPKKIEEVLHTFGVEIVLPLSVLMVAIVIIAVMMYMYRFELTYVSHLFKMKKAGAETDEQRYKTCIYDAFVCYSARNFDWVVGTLLPALEGGPAGYRLCVHDRDFALGAGINSNIVASLEKSRKVILVLSRDFIASKWCQWELEMANHKMFEEKRNYIILVELERLERRALPRHLRYLMDRTTYLEWPAAGVAGPAGHEQRCWRRLRDALGDSLQARAPPQPPPPFTVLDAAAAWQEVSPESS